MVKGALSTFAYPPTPYLLHTQMHVQDISVMWPISITFDSLVSWVSTVENLLLNNKITLLGVGVFVLVLIANINDRLALYSNAVTKCSQVKSLLFSLFLSCLLLRVLCNCSIFWQVNFLKSRCSSVLKHFKKIYL